METRVPFMDDAESSNRPAWTQTLEQGCGSGMEAYKHKQPKKADEPLKRDYYVRSKGRK